MRGVHPLMRLGVLLAATAAACSENTGPAERTDRILFVSNRDGGTVGSDIFRMRPDGQGVENLTQEPTNYADLDATRDGGTVIFAATRPRNGTWTSTTDCPARIWRMAPDGSQLRPITSGPSCSYNPRLSPGNTRVAYERGTDVFVANLDGTGETLLTAALPAVDPTPCGATPKVTVHLTGWYAEDRVSFWRYICQVGRTYYTVAANGTDLRVVDASGPPTTWVSPDRTRVAYVLDGQLWVRNADGSAPRAVAPTTAVMDDGFFARPSPWSPDGRSLVFVDASGKRAVVSVDGGTVKPLTMQTTAVEFSGWAPDAGQLAWTVYTAGSPVTDIHVVGTDGSEMVNLTRSSATNRYAIWVGAR